MISFNEIFGDKELEEQVNQKLRLSFDCECLLTLEYCGQLSLEESA